MFLNKCIYCNQEKNEIDFSLEHIFPDAFGGSFLPQIFKTKSVCKKCNNLAGLYIDAPVINSFFASQLFLTNEYLGYYDFSNEPYIPFRYTGFANDYIKHKDYDFCEMWLWFDGSKVYHFHNNSNDDFEFISGGDPRKRKNNKSAGEIYIVGISNENYWIELLFKACLTKFKKSKIFLVNHLLKDNKKVHSEEQKRIINELFKTKDVKNSIPNKLDFDVRFKAKLSLGLGSTLFEDSFMHSKEATNLRDIFWNKDYENLNKLKPAMNNFFKENKDLDKLFKFFNVPGTLSNIF